MSGDEKRPGANGRSDRLRVAADRSRPEDVAALRRQEHQTGAASDALPGGAHGQASSGIPGRWSPTSKYARGFLLLGVLLLVAFFLELALGSVTVPLGEILRILTGGASKSTWQKIVILFRLPRAVTALIAGAGLSVCGLQMQTIFRNPLAGPSVLGINAGASLGVAAVVMATAGTAGTVSLLTGLGLVGEFGLVAAAGAGSMLVLALVLIVARRVQSVMTLLILGLLFGYATSAVVTVLMNFSIADRIHAYISWTFGSFGGVTWRDLSVFAPIGLAGIIVSQFFSKQLNAFLLGENYATSMGVNVKLARTVILVTTALIAGSVTAFCGPIGFIGIAIPHLCRSLLNTSDHRVLLPGTALCGAIAAILSDLVAQVPGSGIVLPLNAVTSLLGTPVIIWVILRRKNVKATFAS